MTSFKRKQSIVASFSAPIASIRETASALYLFNVNSGYIINSIGGEHQKPKSGTAKGRRSLVCKAELRAHQLASARHGKINKFATASQFAALLNSVGENPSSELVGTCSTMSDVVDAFRAVDESSDSSNSDSSTELDLSVEGISSMFFLEKYPMLEKLALNVNKVSSLDGIEQARYLKYVSLSDNCLREIKEIERLKELVFINFDSNRLEVASLSRMSSLSTLSLNCNQLESVSLDYLPKLRRLELYSNKLQTAQFLACDLSSLVHLNLGRNRIQTLDGVVFSRLLHLQTLILSQNMIQEFPTGLQLLCLSALWLNGNKIAGCLRGASKMSLPALKKLYLQDNHISDIEETFPLSMPLLSELDMSFNQIRTLSVVSSISRWLMLEVVNITDNPISGQRNRMSSVLHLDLISQPYIKFYNGESVVRRDKSATIQTMRARKYPRYNRKLIQLSYCLRFAVEMCTSVIKRESIRRKGRKKSSLEDAVEIDSAQLQLLRIQHDALQAAKDINRISWSKHIADLFTKVFITVPFSPVSAKKISGANDILSDKSHSVKEKKIVTSSPSSGERASHIEQLNLDDSHISLRAFASEEPPGAKITEVLSSDINNSDVLRDPPELATIDPDEAPAPNLVQNDIASEMGETGFLQRSKDLSASQIQRVFRARQRRKQLQHVLKSVRYADLEIEEIFDVGDEDLLDADQWLNTDIDSADVDFSTPLPPSLLAVKPLPAKEEHAAVSNTLAYGDHIRKRSLHSDVRPSGSSHDSEEEDTVLTTKSAPDQNFSPKPDPSGRNTRTNILKDWGIQNDALAATLLKRNKKLK